jgi:hypothetical protein
MGLEGAAQCIHIQVGERAVEPCNPERLVSLLIEKPNLSKFPIESRRCKVAGQKGRPYRGPVPRNAHGVDEHRAAQVWEYAAAHLGEHGDPPGRGPNSHDFGENTILPEKRAVEKTHGGKVPKADFPTMLGNPAKSAGFPLSPSPDGDYFDPKRRKDVVLRR